jgi:choline dehydrogenase-like flavoprotein
LPVLNFTEDGEAILAGMDPKTATSYLPEGTDPSVTAGYEAQVEHTVKMHKERSTAAQELMYTGGGTGLSSILLHPLSRGSVQLNSTDPFEDPLVDPRYLSHPSDGRILVESVKYSRKIMATEALQRTGATEIFPGAQVTSDEAILESLRGVTTTVWHPAGTCAMMPREIGGVVDSELKVYGVENLRVVDASVMPILPAAHMQATVYAIAEKVLPLWHDKLDRRS